MRLFIAIEIPQNIKENICEIRKTIYGVKWTPREQLHITIKFIGEVQENEQALIRERLAEIKWSSFTITLNGTGFFPSSRKPRILWMGIERSENLFELKQKIDLALSDLGINTENRDFTPHLTLARLSGNKQTDISKMIERFSSIGQFTVQVDSFILFSSLLTSKGAVHEIIQEYAV